MSDETTAEPGIGHNSDPMNVEQMVEEFQAAAKLYIDRIKTILAKVKKCPTNMKGDINNARIALTLSKQLTIATGKTDELKGDAKKPYDKVGKAIGAAEKKMVDGVTEARADLGAALKTYFEGLPEDKREAIDNEYGNKAYIKTSQKLVYNVAALPAKFISNETSVVVDEGAILLALEAGDKIKGASIERDFTVIVS